MNDTDTTDLAELSDPALLEARHELDVKLATDPANVVPAEYIAIEREVARRVSGVIWTDPRP